MATDASRMYAKNVEEVVKHLTPAKDAPPGSPVRLDLSDEITAGSLALYQGEARHAAAQAALAGGAP
jgi:NAD/NADP transhydrogenase alpha subunit